MSTWRERKYGEREFGLVPAVLRSRSWMPRELTLTLDDALEALDHFEAAGATKVQWETLQGYSDRRIGGDFTVDGMSGVYGSREDFTIAEVREALREEDAYLRSSVDGVHEVLFCLMIMD